MYDDEFSPREVLRSEVSAPPPTAKDWTGFTRGGIKVLGFSRRCLNTLFWVVECECGRVWEVRGNNLGPAGLQYCASCAAKHRWATQKTPRPTKPDHIHRKNYQRTYQVWWLIRRNYQLVPEWDTFAKFVAVAGYAMTDKPYAHYDINKPVGPGNFSWEATRSNIRFRNAQGQPATIRELGEIYNVSYSQAYYRLRAAQEAGLPDVYFLENAHLFHPAMCRRAKQVRRSSKTPIPQE